MADGRLQFGWTVAPAGYRWVRAVDVERPENPVLEGANPPQLALVPVEGGPIAGAGASPLRPESDAALFRNFAELRPDEGSIVAFAGRHGSLSQFEIFPATRTESVGGSPMRGTLLINWKDNISAMRRLVGLWDLLREPDRERLAAHVRWQETATESLSVHFDSHPDGGSGGGPALGLQPTRAVIASRDFHPELLAEFEAGDPVAPAWAYLRQDLDNHLFDLGRQEGAAGLVAVADWDPKSGRPSLRFVAPTLLTAIWVQLADAVSNDRTFGRCRECGRWFAVAPGAARGHRRTCSNACRSRSFRERQERARQLHAAQKSFEEIAKELDSDVATVRKWVTGFKE
jgi:hypothetical protein